MTRDRSGDIFGLDLQAFHQIAHRVLHDGRIHDGMIDNGFRRQRQKPQVLQLVAALDFLELHQLHGTGADVDADDILLALKQHGKESWRWK